VKRVWPLTLRGAGALVLAVVCFAVAAQTALIGLVYFGVLLVALVIVSFVAVHLGHRTETVARSLRPDVAAVGRDVTVTLRVDVRTVLPSATGSWRDTVPRAVDGNARGSFPALGSGLRGEARTVELEYDLDAVRRGVHWLGPLEVTTADPFGLVRRTVVAGGRTRVVVAPAVVDLPPVSSFAGDVGGALHTTSSQLGQGSDNLTPRHYIAGDSMRRIHWRASAHRDTLMVRQEEQEATPEATVILDRGVSRWSHDAAEEPGLDPQFETAVSACISAVSRLVHDGYRVEIFDGDGSPLSEAIDGADAGAVEAAATQFATLTAHGDASLGSLPPLFAGTSTGPVILVTGALRPTDVDALAALPHHSALPVLLAVAPQADSLARAEATGWRAVAVPRDADLPDAWAGVVERGVSRALT
jgi:uncharacterized protein (DUF58 family)